MGKENNENVDPKIAEVEAVLAAQSAELERLRAIEVKVLESKKAELEAAIKAAPEAVQKKFTGRDLDPEKDLPALHAEIQTYEELLADAQSKAQQVISDHNKSLDEYRESLKKKFGVNIPGIQDVAKIKAETPDPPKQNAQEHVPQTRLSELATKRTLTFNDVNRITGGLSTMTAYAEERKKAVVSGLNQE